MCIRDSELGVGFGNVLVGRQAIVEQRAHQVQARPIVLQRGVEQTPLLVGDAQLEVRLCQLALRAEQRGRDLRRAGERVVAVLGLSLIHI